MSGSLIHLPQLAVQPEQAPDPLTQYGKLQSIQALSAQRQQQQALMPGQLQMQQQQLEAGLLENKQRQVDAQDQQTMRDQAPKFVQKDSSGKVTGFDSDGYYNSLLANAVSPGKVAAARTQQATMVKTMADAGEASLKLQDAKNDNAYQILEGVRSIAKSPTAGPNTVQGAYTDALGKLQQLQVDTSKFPQQFSQVGEAGLQQFEAQIGLHKQVVNDAKTQAETGKDAAQGAEATAAATQKQQESAFYNKLGAGAPGVPAEMTQMTDALRRGVIQNPSQWPAYEAQQKSQAEAPVRIATAQAEGIARANIEAQTARGSDAALATVPPHLVGPATAAATKAGEDYAQSQSVSQRLQAMMDAAKKGNVVSYQLIPEEGALQVTTSQGVHRINMAEIQNYGGGSLWQKMQGHFGKALTGQSIPSSVLSDMTDMQKIQSEGSQTKYNNALKTINQSYGAKFQPVQMDTMPRNNAAQIMTKTYQGHSYAQQSDGSWKLQQ